jgi:hypothetical protein
VEVSAAAGGAQSGRCRYCGDQLDSRMSQIQTGQGDELVEDEAVGSSGSPTEVREPIDWVKTWAQGSLGSLGRFQLRERLGDGGFGRVFRAYDPRLDRDVALKVLKQAQPSERVMGRFFREARAVARLDHPNIATVYDAGFDNGSSWVAYQLVSGRPLWWYREHQRVDAATAARMVRALADALDHSHHMGVVHRDIKPGNVIIDDRGQPRLIDFGLARRSDLDSDLTRDGAILGTPAYMSPEQALGHSRQADERADVYGLGVIFYELLTGHHPDQGTTRSSDPPAPPRPAPERESQADLGRKVFARRGAGYWHRSSIPDELVQICAKAMASEPSERYPTARVLADQLDRWLLRQQHRRNRNRLILACIAAGLFASLIVATSLAILTRAGPLVAAGAARSGFFGGPVPIKEPAPTAGIGEAAPVPGAAAPRLSADEGSSALIETGSGTREAVQLIGNRQSQIYHSAGCSRLRQLAENHRVVFASPAEAAAMGYRPCQTCRPPEARGVAAKRDFSEKSGHRR